MVSCVCMACAILWAVYPAWYDPSGMSSDACMWHALWWYAPDWHVLPHHVPGQLAPRCTHLRTHSSNHTAIHACTHPRAHATIHVLMHRTICACMHTSTHTLIHARTHSCMHPCTLAPSSKDLGPELAKQPPGLARWSGLPVAIWYKARWIGFGM